MDKIKNYFYILNILFFVFGGLLFISNNIVLLNQSDRLIYSVSGYSDKAALRDLSSEDSADNREKAFAIARKYNLEGQEFTLNYTPSKIVFGMIFLMMVVVFLGGVIGVMSGDDKPLSTVGISAIFINVILSVFIGKQNEVKANVYTIPKAIPEIVCVQAPLGLTTVEKEKKATELFWKIKRSVAATSQAEADLEK